MFLVAVFFAVVGVSAFLTVRYIVRAAPEVIVPDLVGQDTITALKILAKGKLNLKVQGFAYSDTILKDKIITQDPAQGVRIKRRRDVRVIISKGAQAIAMPSLMGLSLKQAQNILEQAGLTVGYKSFTYGGEPDRVLTQIPEPKTQVDSLTRVDLLVGLGPRPTALIMPDFTAQTYGLAVLNLERADLFAGPFKYERRANWPLGAVLIQAPAPGGRIEKGSAVILTINQGEAQDAVGLYSLKLVGYETPYGLLRRQIRIEVRLGQFTFDIHDDWHDPGEWVRVVSISFGDLKAWAYEDGVKQEILQINYTRRRLQNE